MRNHSQIKRKRLARDAGCALPSPGHSPGGAKNKEMNPASSNMPSDWYPEKSWAALTKDKKHRKQMSSMARGQTLRNSAIDASSPTQQTAMSMWFVLDSQNSVGAYQTRPQCGKACPTSRK